jgi:homoserine O-succinyltransferase
VLTTVFPMPAPQLAVHDIRERRARRGSIRDRGKRIEIGLVNNMPDAAVAATERQFTRLLEAASSEFDIALRLYALDEVPRTIETRAAMARSHHNPAHLLIRPPDALIVTGAEPQTPTLPQEPYWKALTTLIDWADGHTISMLLSCLAGVQREPLPVKRSGVFAFEIVSEHRLVAGMGARYLAPHSRHNGLNDGALTREGYFVLARSDVGEVDLFIKDRGCLMVFVQGHAEYDDDSLAREYRRDIARYLRGERDAAPAPPERYYPACAIAPLQAFAARARLERSPDLMNDFPTLGGLGPSDAPWRKPGAQLYRNWIGVIAERKLARLAPTTFAMRRWGG